MPVARNLMAMFAKLRGMKQGGGALRKLGTAAKRVAGGLKGKVGSVSRFKPGQTGTIRPLAAKAASAARSAQRKAGSLVRRASKSTIVSVTNPKNQGIALGLGVNAASHAAAFGVSRHLSKKSTAEGPSTTRAVVSTVLGGPAGYLGYRSGLKARMKKQKMQKVRRAK